MSGWASGKQEARDEIMRTRDRVVPIIVQAIQDAQHAGDLPHFELRPEEIELERPRAAGHGDWSSPIALRVKDRAQLAPRQIAEVIAARLPTDGESMLARAEVAGPGFLNLWLSPAWLARRVDRMLQAGSHYADPAVGHGKRVLVEFVSANPTGPLTVGHGRGAVIGDTLSTILTACGYDVTREYYFNDGGLQMRNLAESVRVRAQQASGQDVPLPDNYYVGDYIAAIAANLLATHQAATVLQADWTWLRDQAVVVIFADIRRTLARLGINFDMYFNELVLYDAARNPNIWQVVDQLRARDLAYDLEGAVWLRATALHGATRDRVLVRSSGEPTYRLPDIAYHLDKLARGFDLLVNVLGSDHIDEFPDVTAAVAALGQDASKIRVVVNQFVTLVRGGEVVKMSTRKANYVTLDELIDEVGVNAVRYFMISRAPASQFEFDLDLARKEGEDNPALYAQYAHARTAGILERRAPEMGIAYGPEADVHLLRHPAEHALIDMLLQLEDTLVHCAERLEPHHLAYYATNLATTFTKFYDLCRVLNRDDIPLSQARLKLVKAAQNGLARTLGLMGMAAPTTM
jgi:arginyl-tRNA synthetase